ncbi:MAG: GNAT family N-acetyltransferase, partial [Anaerolineaceae bacterium]
GNEVAEGASLLNKASIPTFPYPDTAARMFDYMAQFADNLRSLYETPTSNPNNNHNSYDYKKAEQIIAHVRETGRTILTEFESKELLKSYNIPTVETRIALTEDEAVKAAEEIGFPVVLKLHSETITHKTDVGGVQLDLVDADAVRNAFDAIKTSVNNKAGEKSKDGTPNFLGVTVQPMAKLEGYELILGSSVDPQFGPVLLFGLGGQLVEVFKDRALGLPPLNAILARRMMEQTRIYKALKGVRGRKAVDLEALETLLVDFSRLVVDHPWIKELDINPLLASPENLLALDARVVIHDANVNDENLPKLAIRPYPTQYVDTWKAKNGWEIIIRPIRPEDEIPLVEFHETLSDRTVYLRYLHPMLLNQRIAHERLARICHTDYDREITLIAEYKDPATDQYKILGAGRLSKLHTMNAARISILISDLCQGVGIGTELLRRVIQVAKDEKLEEIEAVITHDNQVMNHIFTKLGFTITPIEDNKISAKLSLN